MLNGRHLNVPGKQTLDKYPRGIRVFRKQESGGKGKTLGVPWDVYPGCKGSGTGIGSVVLHGLYS